MSLKNYVSNREANIQNFKEALKEYTKIFGVSKIIDSVLIRIENEISVMNAENIDLSDYLESINVYINETNDSNDKVSKLILSIIVRGYASDEEILSESTDFPEDSEFHKSVSSLMSLDVKDSTKALKNIPHFLKIITESIFRSILSNSSQTTPEILDSSKWYQDKSNVLIGLVSMGDENNQKISLLLMLYTAMECFFMIDTYQVTNLNPSIFDQIMAQPEKFKYKPLYLKGMISAAKIKPENEGESNKNEISSVLSCLSNYLNVTELRTKKITKDDNFKLITNNLENKMSIYTEPKKKKSLHLNTSKFSVDRGRGINPWLWMMSMVGTQALGEITIDFVNFLERSQE